MRIRVIHLIEATRFGKNRIMAPENFERIVPALDGGKVPGYECTPHQRESTSPVEKKFYPANNVKEVEYTNEPEPSRQRGRPPRAGGAEAA